MNPNDNKMNYLKRFYRKWQRPLVFIGVATLCSLTVFVVLSSEPEESITIQKDVTQTSGMPVSVRGVEPKSYPAVVKSFGEVVPLWQTAIKAQVDGQITFLSDNLRVGSIVKQGELLVRIEKSEFEMQVAEARNRLSAAKVVLLKEQREARQARKDWERSNIGSKPDSPLVLRTPQLEAAKSELEAAQTALARAQVLLQYTDVHAPFDGVIMQSMVSLGEALFTGGEIATIYGLDTVEVGIHLDEEQWALLPEPIMETNVRLHTPPGTSKSNWKAQVARESRHLDRESRLRTLFVQVKQPLEQMPPLLPGTFVQAEMTGRDIPELVKIPEPALTKQGLVWFVDQENRLQPRRVDPGFYGEGVVYIHVPADIETPIRIAESPNTSFVSGLKVNPIAAKGGGE
jgi:RND family efflux transporter MFP subunit